MTRRLVAVLAAVLALLVTSHPAAVAADDPAADRVVIVGIPGLVWTDVTEDGTPELWSAAASGSIGALTVRSARSVTCVLDGWVTLGAGNRARFIIPPAPEDAVPEVVPPDTGVPRAEENLDGCLPQESGVNLSAVVAALEEFPDLVDDNSYGALPGSLGAAVQCATGVGQGPVLALKRAGARTELVAIAPSDAAGWTGLVSQCPVTVVSMPELVAAVDRGAALARLDDQLAMLRSGLPPETELIVVGSSETGLNNSSLHVAIEVGPGVAPGYLTSASTGRAPFVQLIDVAPTALDRLGIDAPSAMVGQPLQPGQPRPESLTEAIAELIDANVAARAQGSLTSTFFLMLVVLTGALCPLCLLALRNGGSKLRVVVRLVTLVVATLPVATFLANLVPWWRAGRPVLLLAILVAAAMSLISVLALAGPWRGRRFAPELVVVTVTFATLAADVLLLGSRLQLNGLLGYNPIVAGRFIGFGNIPFGIYAASALLVTTAVVRAAPARRERVVLVIAAVAVVAVDGAPGLGSDFGGVLALVPAYGVFAIVLLQLRPSAARFGLAGLAGAVVVIGIAALDYLRPQEEQTHLGRFIGQLLDGSASSIVQRKAESNIGILLHSPLSLLIPVFVATLWWLLRRGGQLHGLLAQREWRAGLAAVAVAEVIGLLVNDSGIAVPVAAGWLLVPLALSVAAADRRDADPRVARAVGPDPRTEGVTVNSRESAGPAD
ncbi:MAG: hypothetical protein ACR2JK_09440 [Geodermatophilaceae bacterium]